MRGKSGSRRSKPRRSKPRRSKPRRNARHATYRSGDSGVLASTYKFVSKHTNIQIGQLTYLVKQGSRIHDNKLYNLTTNEEIVDVPNISAIHTSSLQVSLEIRRSVGLCECDHRGKNPVKYMNFVRVCPNPKCKKGCSVSQTNCNGCNETLNEVTPSYGTDNPFTLFLDGYKQWSPSFVIPSTLIDNTLYVRYSDNDVMVVDDALRMSHVHLLAIPTMYIPDLRYLFTVPRVGLDILHMLKNAYKDAFDDMKTKGHHTLENYKDDTIFAFNLPPSQYQLHLQCIPLPMLHGQYDNWETKHFLETRHFPYAYVEACLKKQKSNPSYDPYDDEQIQCRPPPNTVETMNGIQAQTDECFEVTRFKAHFATLGVHHKTYWESDREKVKASEGQIIDSHRPTFQIPIEIGQVAIKSTSKTSNLLDEIEFN